MRVFPGHFFLSELSSSDQLELIVEKALVKYNLAEKSRSHVTDDLLKFINDFKASGLITSDDRSSDLSDDLKDGLATDLGFLRKYDQIQRAFSAQMRPFKHNQQNVGCFSINYTTSFGVRACNPIIYVSNRVFSVLCILKMFQYIFTKLEVDKISFVVFSHNTPCLLALKKMRIHCDGELKYYREYNNRHISCYVFSILPEEYASLRERVNNYFNGC